MHSHTLSQGRASVRRFLGALKEFSVNFKWHRHTEPLVIEGEDATDKVLEAYRRGVRNFDGSIFPDNADFCEQKLHRVSFAGARLTQAWFCCGSFRGACFANAFLEESSFDDSDCRGVDFSGANLAGAEFQNTDLKGAKFTDAQLQGAFFDRADLVGVDLTGANVQDAEFLDVRRVRSEPPFVEL